MNVKQYTVETITPSEFETAKAAGVKFVRNHDQYYLDGENYIVVIYPPFEGRNGTCKYPVHVQYTIA